MPAVTFVERLDSWKNISFLRMETIYGLRQVMVECKGGQRCQYRRAVEKALSQ